MVFWGFPLFVEAHFVLEVGFRNNLFTRSKIMAKSFFSLPVDVFQGPVLSFLTPSCLSQLDCAVANHFLRWELSEYFKNAVVENQKDEYVFRLDVCSLQWALSRHLYFINISVVDRGLREHCDVVSTVVALASHVEFEPDALQGDQIVQMLQGCQHLRSLALSHNDGITDAVLSAITTQHTQLTVLNIASCKDLSSHALQAIARNCTTLERLDIGYNSTLDENHLARMLCQLPNLRWLDVTEACLQARHWTMIFNHCSLLEHINISSTDISEAMMTYMGHKCTHITSVTMHETGNDTKVVALAQALPGLLKLDHSESYQVSSGGIVELSSSCRNLHTLILSNSCCISDDVLIALARNCPRLTHLDLFYNIGLETSDVGIVAVAEACPLLETMMFPYCGKITDTSVLALAHNCPSLRKVGALHQAITDTGTIALSTHCPQLTYLTLGYSTITDAALVSLATNLPGLRELCFQECAKITSAGLITIVQRCAYLNSLQILGCIRIDDAGVIAVVQHCRRLRFLELEELPAVTDAFADVCIARKLRAELFFMSTGITKEKVEELNQHCRKIYG